MQPRAVVGFDTRFLSDRYAWAVAEVLAANGLCVSLTKADAPTPVVSFAIPTLKAVGGVMITASHNPPRYNGIKLKSAYGGSATVADTKRVEAKLEAALAGGREPRRMELDEAIERGLVDRFDPFPAYAAHLEQLIDFDTIRRAHLRVAVDAMYGTGRTYLRRLLETAGCEVTEIRGEMNPGFNGIHPEPIAKHLGPLTELMESGEYDLGLATDGDADRIGAAGPSGAFIDPHRIMTLALRYLVEVRGKRGAVVKTVSTTQMLNRLAAKYGLPLHETPVGFNYIGDLMMANDVLIGGEESGGISIKGHIPEGDGVLMGMLMAELVAYYGKSPEALMDEVMGEIGHFDYARNDFQVKPFEKKTLVGAVSGDGAAGAGRGRAGHGEHAGWGEVPVQRQQLAADPAERDGAGAAGLRRGAHAGGGAGAAGRGTAAGGRGGSVRGNGETRFLAETWFLCKGESAKTPACDWRRIHRCKSLYALPRGAISITKTINSSLWSA